MRIHFLHIDNDALLEGTKELASATTALEAKLLYRLDEIRCRAIPVNMGYGSMARFCVDQLGMTEDQAEKRLAALTNCRRWPELMILLEEGVVSLSAVNMVGPRLTQANKNLILSGVAGKSTRKLRQLLASVDNSGQVSETPALIDLKLTLTAADLADLERVQELAAKGRMMTVEAALVAAVQVYLEKHDPLRVAARVLARKERTHGDVGPCRAAESVTLEKSESDDRGPCRAADSAKLEKSESDDSGSCRAAASVTLEKSESDDAGSCHAVGRQGQRHPPASTRYVPAHLRHQVVLRAKGRCEHPGCTETKGLQLDHKLRPFSMGGEHSLENLQLLCPACHRLKTAREFSREFLEAKVSERIRRIEGFEYTRGGYLPPVDGWRRPPTWPRNCAYPEGPRW